MKPVGLTDLETALEHRFHDQSLLVRALTHSSLAYELTSDSSSSSHSMAADNEQLEFLGDAVVGLLVAEALYREYPALTEGQLSRLRAALVSRQHLGRAAATLHLGDYMFLGKGEERSGGRKKSALLADCMEAVIGAIYLDAGLEAARKFVEREVIAPDVARLHLELTRGSSIGDHKSALQEFLQAHKSGHPAYAVRAESGPDHRRRFLVEVRIAGNGSQTRALARGIGTTKKRAEQEAARRALRKLLSGASIQKAEEVVL